LVLQSTMATFGRYPSRSIMASTIQFVDLKPFLHSLRALANVAGVGREAVIL
jgi:hypothetical protein